MRLFIVLLLCLGLATCTTQVPRLQMLGPASQDLAGRYSFELIAPIVCSGKAPSAPASALHMTAPNCSSAPPAP